jgi:Protein of unknown function (DUF3147)
MILSYLARFVAGGLLVCVFALISQACMPKQFAGIFSAAPSILLAGLVITLFTKGATHAALTTEGAIAGAIGMIFYCVMATPAIKRFKTIIGIILPLLGWFVVSFCAFVVMSIVLKW